METSTALRLRATDFMPALRGKTPSSASAALAQPVPAFRNEVKSVAPFPVDEREGFLHENWLFVFPVAMFVLLASCAAVMALT